jgi:hypothetical protein
MKTKINNKFNSVDYFRKIKEKLAELMDGMTLKQQQDFMKKVRDGKIKI